MCEFCEDMRNYQPASFIGIQREEESEQFVKHYDELVKIKAIIDSRMLNEGYLYEVKYCEVCNKELKDEMYE